ncbi:MAG: tetratricopeptide repeat protein [Gammaproteobacteria bacterium]|nr:tetratricopeptide repeat protein [Gammaproteobacteria bacterium]
MHIKIHLLVFITLLSACASIDKTDFELDRQNADRFFATGSYQQAFELYQKSAMQGDKFSQYRLAQMHENGFGTETSLSKAFAWASVASEFGTYFLVNYWHQLDDIIHPSDRQRINALAYAYFRKYNSTALSPDLQKTQPNNTNLVEYANTLYTDKNYESAFAMYHELASIGEKFSQHRLARMFESGQGVEPSLIKAYAWAVLSTELNSPLLSAYLKELDTKLDDKMILQAQSYLQSIASESGIVALTRERIRKLRSARFHGSCKGRPRAICEEFIAAVCAGSKECSTNYPGGVLRARAGTSIDETYVHQTTVMESIIEDYRKTAEQVILGEFKVLEDESDDTAEEPQPQPQNNDDD